ncbi:LOW QUALITY PROTEIN: hypothetical protein CFC21_057442 [Triticum aestivum]|uniref:Cytochrome c oxidase subunit 6a, mitochondrial n=2 Tax=Triticum aestivum TaxID=4565 RepID=A0A3B6INK3_WHEAT|nr:LOW QUALITY PROTEIN: hypothetical protein CFC21_057442 [Triticum aestivum]
MASLTARSGLRSLATRARRPGPAPVGRRMSSSAQDDAYEMSKWEKITTMGVTYTLMAAWNLSKGHPHFDEPPAYPYLHIHNKEFPWGMNCLPLPSRAHFNAYVCNFLLDLTV